MNIFLIWGIAGLMGVNSLTQQGQPRINDVIPKYAMQTTIGVGLEAKHFGAEITTDTDMVFYSLRSFVPYHAQYTTDLYLKYNDIKVGWEHVCNHPIISERMQREVKYFGGYDKIYIEGRLKMEVK
jgi:hypothetical protein